MSSGLPVVEYLGVPVWRWFGFSCPRGHRWARLMQDPGAAPYSRCPACSGSAASELHQAEVVVRWAEAPPRQQTAEPATTTTQPATAKPTKPTPTKPKPTKPTPTGGRRTGAITCSEALVLASSSGIPRVWRSGTEWAELAQHTGWKSRSSTLDGTRKSAVLALRSLVKRAGWEERGKRGKLRWRHPERAAEPEPEPKSLAHGARLSAPAALRQVAAAQGDALGWMDRENWAGWAEAAGWEAPKKSSERLATIESALGVVGWPCEQRDGRPHWRPSGRQR